MSMGRCANVIAAGAIACALASCGGKANPNPLRAELAVSVQREQGISVYTLSCPSARGSFPDPSSACKAMNSANGMLGPPKMTATCAGSEGVPPQITVKGRADGKRVDYSVRS